MLKSENGKPLSKPVGIIFAMMDVLGEKLNFTYTIAQPPDNAFGSKSSGQWTGMIGQLARKEVIMAAAPFNIDSQRQEVVNFSVPIDLQPYTFMFRRPQQLSRATLFVEPFTTLV